MRSHESSRISGSVMMGSNKMVKEEDIISNLPEHIIHHILSYLEMKYVVQTCILSKRWISLWKTLPSLNFDFDTHYNNLHVLFKLKRREEFTDFLYNVLTLRDMSSNITSFRLAYSFFSMEAWMRFVTLRHNVQLLDIYIKTNRSGSVLPHCLFNCNSLVTLKLNIRLEWVTNPIPVLVHLPQSVNLPSLRALHLQSFCFCGGNDFIPKLISSSPVLDTLSIIDCGLRDTYTLTICSAQLKHLELDGIYACDCLGGLYYLQCCRIQISAPLVTSFKCTGYLWNEYLVEDLSSLYKADIDMDIRMTCETAEGYLVMDSSQKEQFGRNMMKFLEGLSNAKSLTLSPCLLLEVIQQAMGTSSISFPVLKQLKLKMGPYSDCILGIKYMLQIFCNLEALILEIPTAKVDPAKSYEYWEADFCNFHHLRSVEMRNAMGCINELMFLELLLKNAIALEKLIIFFWKEHSSSSQRHHTEFIEILLAFPRASPNVAIAFF